MQWYTKISTHSHCRLWFFVREERPCIHERWLFHFPIWFVSEISASKDYLIPTFGYVEMESCVSIRLLSEFTLMIINGLPEHILLSSCNPFWLHPSQCLGLIVEGWQAPQLLVKSEPHKWKKWNQHILYAHCWIETVTKKEMERRLRSKKRGEMEKEEQGIPYLWGWGGAHGTVSCSFPQAKVPSESLHEGKFQPRRTHCTGPAADRIDFSPFTKDHRVAGPLSLCIHSIF